MHLFALPHSLGHLRENTWLTDCLFSRILFVHSVVHISPWATIFTVLCLLMLFVSMLLLGYRHNISVVHPHVMCSVWLLLLLLPLWCCDPTVSILSLCPGARHEHVNILCILYYEVEIEECSSWLWSGSFRSLILNAFVPPFAPDQRVCQMHQNPWLTHQLV